MTVQYDLYVAVRNFALSLIPTAQVIKGFGNDVAMPLDPYIMMTGIGSRRLGTNVHTYIDPVTTVGIVNNMQPMALDIQIDCYGDTANDWISTLTTMWNDIYSYDYFSTLDASPLYHSEPRQMTFTNSANNYEQRWLSTFTLQYNPITGTPMHFFDNMTLTLDAI